ncbi:MAG: DUF4124 domain-containing protein [Burkholderiales bacterium]
MRFALFILALMAGAAGAETLYKSVGADGKVTYSDRPTDDSSAKALNFSNLPPSALPESLVHYQRDLQKGVDARLSATSNGEAQFFMAQWCGYCRQAKAYLNAKKIVYREYDVETPAGKNAFAQFGGGGIPVLLWKGRRVNGFSPAAYDSLFSVR